MYSKSILNEIRDRVSIVSFIGGRVPLKRAGRNFKGLCPFHNEKTPSFNVSDEKGIFHCFGCGVGGDIFQFVMKFDGMGFADAVKTLAEHAGVKLPQNYDPAAKAREDELTRKRRLCLEINNIARAYFTNCLLDTNTGKAAGEYLKGRGIAEEFWTQLFLGFADNNWDSLTYHLKEKKVPLDLACELGLIKQREGGGYYDFFRNRIIFSIVSHRNEVLGFSGRDIAGETEGAKYINSPDSIIYHKSNCLYGLNMAQTAIRTEDSAILVEGNMDIISLVQAGITNVIAPLGTALTSGHLRLLARYTRNMTVIFDGDEAGIKAGIRALPVFIEAGLSPRIVPLPSGQDPDSLVRKEGKELFHRRIANARSLFEYFVDKTIEASGSDATGRVTALSKIAPLLKDVTNPAERGIYRRYAAQRLNVDEHAIEQSIAPKRVKTKTQIPEPLPAGGNKTRHFPSAERMLTEMLICHPDMAQDVFTTIAPEDFEDNWCKMVACLISDEWKRSGVVRISDLIEGIADTELAQQLRQITLDTEGICNGNEVKDVVKDCIARIKERPVLTRIERLNEEIRDAESSGNEEALLKLLAEKSALVRTFKTTPHPTLSPEGRG